MTDREIMQQALNALKMADELCDGHGVDFKEYGLKVDRDIQRKYKKALTALQERLAHCDRCGKRLGGEGDIHTCTPLEQKRFEQWWDAEDDILNDGPYTPDTPIQFAWAGWQAALAQPKQEPVHYGPSSSVFGLAEMILSDCGCSSDYQPLLNRVAARIMGYIDTPPAAQPAPAGYIKKIEDLILERDDARASRDFYKRRADALQQWQHKMRDPERTIVCDILANGHTLEPAGNRYTPPAAQPEQEPECWCHKCNENRLVNNVPISMTRMIVCPTCGNKRCPKASDHRLDCTDSNEPNQSGSVYITLPAPVQPEQEPVAIALNTGTKQGVKWLKNVEHGENLYTTPPAAAQRTWVGLTNEDIALIDWESLVTKKDCVRAIEAKLKEKNNG